MIWIPYKKLLLGELYDAALKLEEYIALSISTEVYFEEVDVLEAIGNVGIKVDWMDQAIREIHKRGNIMS